MVLITVFLLLGPGILMWKLGDDQDLSSGTAIIRMLLNLIFDSFVVLMLSYLTLTLIYGYMAVNLSAVFIEGVGNSIFNISFVWKFGMLSCGYAAAISLGKRLWKRFMKKRSRK